MKILTDKHFKKILELIARQAERKGWINGLNMGYWTGFNRGFDTGYEYSKTHNEPPILIDGSIEERGTAPIPKVWLDWDEGAESSPSPK